MDSHSGGDFGGSDFGGHSHAGDFGSSDLGGHSHHDASVSGHSHHHSGDHHSHHHAAEAPDSAFLGGDPHSLLSNDESTHRLRHGPRSGAEPSAAAKVTLLLLFFGAIAIMVLIGAALSAR